MPLHRTNAIVLLTHRVGEADKIVVFLTREGKLRGMAKGARRPKSRFGSSLEIGTEVELTYFEKERRELVSVDRCDIIRPCFGIAADPVRACTLGYMTELTDAFVQEKEPAERLYRLLRASIDALATADAETTARYFEAWLLRLGGYYPRAETCAACGALLSEGGARYRPEDHLLRCPSCALGGVMVSPEALRYVGEIWLKPPQSIEKPGSPSVLRELGDLHQRIIMRELEKDLRSRAVLEDLLRATSDS